MSFRQELQALRDNYRQQTNQVYRPAVVGDASGNYLDSNLPGFVIVRQKSSNGLSASCPVRPPTDPALRLYPGLDVELDLDKFGRLYIARVDTHARAAATGTPLVSQPPASSGLQQSQFLTLRVLATTVPSLSVAVSAWAPITTGTLHIFPGTVTDLTGSLPAAGQMRYLCPAVKNDYQTLEVSGSTARSVFDMPLDATDGQECLDNLSAGSTPCHLIAVNGTMTAITQADIDTYPSVDLRQIVNSL